MRYYFSVVVAVVVVVVGLVAADGDPGGNICSQIQNLIISAYASQPFHPTVSGIVIHCMSFNYQLFTHQ